METSEKTIEVLNDLVQINNDRTAGFEKAGEDLEEKDSGLKSVFSKLANESRNNAAELSSLAMQFGGEAEGGTSTSGSLHRAWIDVKTTFTGNDLESILNECERGEDAIKKTYRSALEDENDLSPELVQVITRQQQGIVEGHDLIKSLRDQSRNNEENNDNNYRSENENRFQENDRNIFVQKRDTEPEDNYSNEFHPGNKRGQETNNVHESKPSVETGFQPVDSQKTVSTDSKLQEFFVNELKDLLWAEKKLVDTLPKMKEAANSAQLKEAFHSHLAQTEGHVTRLEQIFGVLGVDVDTTKCDAMAGIVDEGEEIIDETDEGTAQRDVGLIFAGQKVEHYEIASYGGMVSLAKTLGYNDAAAILNMTLNEEKAADALLTKIAETNINYAARNEPKKEGLFS